LESKNSELEHVNAESTAAANERYAELEKRSGERVAELESEYKGRIEMLEHEATLMEKAVERAVADAESYKAERDGAIRERNAFAATIEAVRAALEGNVLPTKSDFAYSGGTSISVGNVTFPVLKPGADFAFSDGMSVEFDADSEPDDVPILDDDAISRLIGSAEEPDDGDEDDSFGVVRRAVETAAERAAAQLNELNELPHEQVAQLIDMYADETLDAQPGEVPFERIEVPQSDA
jgi:hypothetical protein